MNKIVIDTNVTIAAFFWNGNPRKIYEAAKHNEIALFYSYPMLTEFIRVLSYPKFGLTQKEIMPIVNDFIKTANQINVTTVIKVITQDPTDNIFLECAVDSKTDFIVSGDHHLLNLKEYNKIKILTPKEYLDKLSQQSKNTNYSIE